MNGQAIGLALGPSGIRAQFGLVPEEDETELVKVTVKAAVGPEGERSGEPGFAFCSHYGMACGLEDLAREGMGQGGWS